MEIIAHRVNTVEELGNVGQRYGVEIDVRSYNDELVLQHDPFKQGELFKEWLNFYRHGTIVVNIKEEGLEPAIIKLLNDFSVTNFFFLDQSFPFIVRYSRLGETRCAVRVSDIEAPQTALRLAGQIEWVWFDTFNELSLDPDHLKELSRLAFKICCVSPELHGQKFLKDVTTLQAWLIKNKVPIDAVCTKRPDLWKHRELQCN